VDDVREIAEVVLHRRDFGQPVQGAHDKERIAQPAITVIPGALGLRRLGNAGRHRGHDRARLFVRAQLQRDRRTNDGILPFERDRQRTHPAPPVIRGTLLELVGEVTDVAVDRLVDTLFRIGIVVLVVHIVLFPVIGSQLDYDALHRPTILGTEAYAGVFGHKNLAGAFFGLMVVICFVRMLAGPRSQFGWTILLMGCHFLALAAAGREALRLRAASLEARQAG